MKTLQLVALCLLCSQATAQGRGVPDIRIMESGLPLSGGTLSGSVNMGGNDLVCVDDIEMVSSCQLTSDAAPSQSVIRTAQDAYPLATVNTSGGDIVLLAGAGATNVNVDDYTQCGASTVTVTINGTAHVFTEGVSWTAATSNAATCTSLCAAIDALTGVSCAACSAAKAPVAVDSGAYSVQVARSTAACATVSAAAKEGQVLLNGFSFQHPAVASLRDPTTGLGLYANYVCLISAGAPTLCGVAGHLQLSNYLDTLTYEIRSSTSYTRIGGGTGTTTHSLGTGDLLVRQALEVDGSTFLDGEVYGIIEADLTAGACTAKRLVIDTGGANRENCRCNSAGTAYDCCTINAAPTCSTNGPVD
jgi:hypothetical protein